MGQTVTVPDNPGSLHYDLRGWAEPRCYVCDAALYLDTAGGWHTVNGDFAHCAGSPTNAYHRVNNRKLHKLAQDIRRARRQLA